MLYQLSYRGSAGRPYSKFCRRAQSLFRRANDARKAYSSLLFGRTNEGARITSDSGFPPPATPPARTVTGRPERTPIRRRESASRPAKAPRSAPRRFLHCFLHLPLWPRRSTFDACSILRTIPELLTPAEMGEADRMTIAAGTPGPALMEAAGLAVADEAARLARSRGRIVVFCGRQQRRRRLRRGAPARDAAIRSSSACRPARGAERRRGLRRGAVRRRGPPPEAVDPEGAACVVDALFGAGLARDIDGGRESGRADQRLQRAGGRVLAVDTPSGVDGASGKIRGVAVEATASVTFFRLKPGHCSSPAGALRRDPARRHRHPRERLPRIGPNAFVNGRLSGAGRCRGSTPGRTNMPAGRRSSSRARASDGRGPARGAGGVAGGGGDRRAREPARIGRRQRRASDRRDGRAVRRRQRFEALLADARRRAVALGPGAGVGRRRASSSRRR